MREAANRWQPHAEEVLEPHVTMLPRYNEDLLDTGQHEYRQWVSRYRSVVDRQELLHVAIVSGCRRVPASSARMFSLHDMVLLLGSSNQGFGGDVDGLGPMATEEAKDAGKQAAI